MNHRKTIFAIAVVFSLLTAVGCISVAAPFTISSSGESECTIVISDRPDPAVINAAAELADSLHKVTGGDYQISNESLDKHQQPRILVGRSFAVDQLLRGQDWEALGQDGIIIKTIKNNLVIAGGTPRGTINAVWVFLQNAVGCEWLTPEDRIFPYKPNLLITNMDYTYSPLYKYRELGNFNAVGEFASYLRLNGGSQDIPVDWGSHLGMLVSRPLPGLCSVNARQTNWAVESLASLVRKDSIAANRPTRTSRSRMMYLNISSEQKTCDCYFCRELARRRSAASAPYIRYVNTVARSFAWQYPGIRVVTPVYPSVGSPQKNLSLYSNITLSLDMNGCDLSKPLGDPAGPAWNQDFENRLAQWRKGSALTWVQGRITGTGSVPLPQPNILALPITLRWLESQNIKGISLNYGSPLIPIDFRELRIWLTAQLLWNPHQDEMKLIRSFLRSYYGAAGKYLENYIILTNTTAARSPVFIRQGNTDYSFMDLNAMNKAQRYMEAAVSAVSYDETLSRRVIKEKLFLDALWLLRYKNLVLEASENNIPFEGPRNPDTATDNLIRSANAAGYSIADDTAETLRAMACSSDAPKPVEEGTWLDFQETWFALRNSGSTVIASDPAASDGRALLLRPSDGAKIFRAPINAAGKWRCYVSLRIKPGISSGAACSLAIEDSITRQTRVAKRISVNASDRNEYTAIDLGVQDMNQGLDLAIKVDGNTGAADSVWLDRYYLVRADQPSNSKNVKTASTAKSTPENTK